jgi:hypothetical protein
MAKTNADCLCFLSDRALGSLHGLRDVHHGRLGFRMGFQLPDIVFGPGTARQGLLFRHVFTLLVGAVSLSLFLVLSDSLETIVLSGRRHALNE